MSYHFRSLSEQPAQQPHQPSFLNNQRQSNLLAPNHLVANANHGTSNGTNGTNGIDDSNDSNNNLIDLPNTNQGSTNGIIMIHSDSQQSLDRLFNPNNTQATVPLRHRNLPASFFNPSWKTDGKDNSSANNELQQRQQNLNLHSRSTSFDLRRPEQNSNGFARTGFHMRTQSTIAPMTASGGQTPSSITGSAGSLISSTNTSLLSTSSSAITANNVTSKTSSTNAISSTNYQAQQPALTQHNNQLHISHQQQQQRLSDANTQHHLQNQHTTHHQCFTHNQPNAQVHQIVVHSRPVNNHYRNYSSPAFVANPVHMPNQASIQPQVQPPSNPPNAANHPYYCSPQSNEPPAPMSVETKSQETMYYAVDTPQETALDEQPYAQQPSLTQQNNQIHHQNHHQNRNNHHIHSQHHHQHSTQQQHQSFDHVQQNVQVNPVIVHSRPVNNHYRNISSPAFAAPMATIQSPIQAQLSTAANPTTNHSYYCSAQANEASNVVMEPKQETMYYNMEAQDTNMAEQAYFF